MYGKLKYKDNTKENLIEERYETIKTLFSISFVITDSLMIFDIVSNFVDKTVDELFYLRFFVTFFGLYGSLIIFGGHYLYEYCDCELTCRCSKILDSFWSFCGCHLFFGGLFLLTSYCIELCSSKFYFNNKDKIKSGLIISFLYLLFIFSTITIILFIFLMINKKTEKKIKKKLE